MLPLKLRMLDLRWILDLIATQLKSATVNSSATLALLSSKTKHR